MDTKAKLRALGVALTMVAAAAGTGWALQLPLTATIDLNPAQAPRVATLAETPVPGGQLTAWPHPAVEEDEDASGRLEAGNAGEIVGLEEMSATGAASPQQ